jgi:hypothetical protein
VKKHKQRYYINNHEDENSSSYPLYPSIEDICNTEKNKMEECRENNTEIIASTGKISEWEDDDNAGMNIKFF